jgi:sporulation-control protein spo0M
MVFGGSSMVVQAAVDRTAFHAGETVTAKVFISGTPDPKVQGARVELAVKNRYREQERDYNHSDHGHDRTRTVTREDTTVVMWQPLPGAPDGPVALGEHTVTLQIPHDAPPSAFEPGGFGDLVTWEVRAILDRRMSMDPDATIKIHVASFANQYAHWAQSPPVAKSHEVPMGLDQLSTRVLRPGEQVTGVLTINPRESAKGRTVRVQLERRRTDTPDNMKFNDTAAQVELARDVKLEPGQPLQFPFQIPLPENVPPTYSASRSHLHWFLEGIVDRKMRSDFVVEAEVAVYTGSPDAAGPQPMATPYAGQQNVPAVASPVQLPGGVTPGPGTFPQQQSPQPIAAPLAPAGGAPGAEATPGSFPPDWYPDPWLQARIRYWDGNAWTGHTSN